MFKNQKQLKINTMRILFFLFFLAFSLVKYNTLTVPPYTDVALILSCSDLSLVTCTCTSADPATAACMCRLGALLHAKLHARVLLLCVLMFPSWVESLGSDSL